MIFKPRTLYCMKLEIRINCILKTVPYEWDSSTDLIRVSRDKKKLILWKLNILTVFLYAFFIYARFYQLVKFHAFEEINKTHFALNLAWVRVVGLSVIVAGHISIWNRKLEIAEFVNAFFTFHKNVEGKHIFEQ